MTIHPRLEPGDAVPDVCIVGSGPVGLALGLECESLGLSVLMLESGRARPGAAPAEASRARIADPRRHAAMETAVCRAFGGTSWLWGGRCVPFDDIDFEPRAYGPTAGWPIAHKEVAPYYAKALAYLAGGEDRFRDAAPAWQGLPGEVAAHSLERWSASPRLAALHGARVARSPRLALVLDSTVTGIELGRDGERVAGLEVASGGGRRTVRARAYVLAAGGLETTRLLLAAQRRWPGHFGGAEGALGRYYAGHLSGKIASLVLADPADIAGLDFAREAGGTYVRRRFTLSPEAQRRDGLLNIAFWADNPPFHDPRHGSGILSAAYLALANPLLGPLLLPEAIRLAHASAARPRLGAHLRNILGRPLRTIGDGARILRERFLARPPKPGFVVRDDGGRYALHYHAEQIPDEASRVTLGDERDGFGVPRLAVDLRYSERDAQSVASAHRVLDDALRAAGKGRLDHWHPEAERVARILDQASDGTHQLGTTRMGRDPRASVVDEDCRIHGLPNLHIASSSVFPTTGQANPTLLAVALALRLAHALASTRASGRGMMDAP